MSNTSATGGYLRPTTTTPIPGNLTLQQFIHNMIVGISGYDGTLVRPKWQVSPPKQPDIDVNWIAFGLQAFKPDSYAYVWMNSDDTSSLQRQEGLEIQCAFYGPNAQENISAFIDGFQIQQNLEALMLANMGYTGFNPPIRGPDLVGERWIDRYEMAIILTRQVQRIYPVLPFASASGIIHTVLEAEYNSPFTVEES